MITPVDIMTDAISFWKKKAVESFGTPRHQEYLFLVGILESLQKDIVSCNNVSFRTLCQHYFNEEFTLKNFIHESKKAYIQVAVDDADTELGARLALDISRNSLTGLRKKFCIKKGT